MIQTFWKIVKEKAAFHRPQLTKLGHVSDKIEKIYTFKEDDDNRYLLFESTGELPVEVHKKLARLANLEVIEDDEGLNEKFQAIKENPKFPSRYLIYFDRDTYVRR